MKLLVTSLLIISAPVMAMFRAPLRPVTRLRPSLKPVQCYSSKSDQRLMEKLQEKHSKLTRFGSECDQYISSWSKEVVACNTYGCLNPDRCKDERQQYDYDKLPPLVSSQPTCITAAMIHLAAKAVLLSEAEALTEQIKNLEQSLSDQKK